MIENTRCQIELSVEPLHVKCVLKVFHHVQFEATLEASSFVVIHSRTEYVIIQRHLLLNDVHAYRDCG
jgi:hypothetical protein